MKKKYKGTDLQEILNQINFDTLKKELQTMLTRQKQRYSINTMVEEYEVTLSIDIRKVRKR
ncbi:MAG: hypothetical protein N3A54_01765 [Patescibacteria group bacterium]|nr:hypothetical protein [Patescibacteria group bacterium]